MIKSLKNEKGQAMVEFALVLPILLLLVCGIIDFGWMFYNQFQLENSCRQAARYSCVNSSYSSTELEDILEENLKNNLIGDMAKTVHVDVEYTDKNKPIKGDVIVTVDAKMKVLTPVLGTFCDNMEKELQSSVTMKVEH